MRLSPDCTGMDFIYLIKIGFLPVRIWDILDVFIVGYLLYQIYKLLKGNIAFNILIGVVMLFLTWELVKQLDMVVLEAVLQRFAGVGFIVIAIIFQQEIRKFLLLLGNTTLKQRAQFLGRILDRNLKDQNANDADVLAIKQALLRMSKRRIGALIVLNKEADLDGIADTGVRLDALISQNLLQSIFAKTSPIHDGAVLIRKERIVAAGCILPVSEKAGLPSSAGLRHRAALGVSERFEVTALVVSEESGNISVAKNGELTRKLDEAALTELLKKETI
ncbi:MAG: diadenylate cyclase CdaA [Bacteroidota bacterium]